MSAKSQLKIASVKLNIVVHYKIIDQKFMAQFLVELYNSRGIPISTQRKLMLATELVMLHVRRLQAEANRLLFHYCETDPEKNGMPKNYPKGPFTFATPEKEKEHDECMKQLWATRVELPVERIALAHVEHAGLSGAVLRALDFMFDGVPPMPKEEDARKIPCSNEPGTEPLGVAPSA